MANHLYGSNWTPERIEQLKKLWATGVPSKEIAAALGLTKSSVLGKVWRLKLSQRATASARNMTPPQPKPKKHSPRPRVSRDWFTSPVPPPGGPLPSERECNPSIKPKYIPLLDLGSNMCRWPYGDGPFLFCGCEALEGSSYCLPHAVIAKGEGTASERAAAKVLERAAA